MRYFVKKFIFLFLSIFLFKNVYTNEQMNFSKKNIDSFIENMSLEEKIGQIFITPIFGNELSKEEKTLIQKTKIGNFIFYNWTSNTLFCKKKIKKFTFELNNFCLGQLKIKPFLTVDQEGGQVCRLKEEEYEKIPSLKEIGKKDEKYSYEIGKILGSQLFEIGLNVNLAPVVDVGERDRSFSSDTDKVISLAKNMIRGMKEKDILVCLKHFPGYGACEKDLHEEKFSYEKEKDFLEKFHMRPFLKLKKETDFIMITHMKVLCFDKDNIATFSKILLEDILRKKYGFKGIIIADSLTMKGASFYQKDLKEAFKNISISCIKAFIAGCDMIILASLEIEEIGKDKDIIYSMIKKCMEDFKRYIENNRSLEKRLNDSVTRILIKKSRLK